MEDVLIGIIFVSGNNKRYTTLLLSGNNFFSHKKVVDIEFYLEIKSNKELETLIKMCDLIMSCSFYMDSPIISEDKLNYIINNNCIAPFFNDQNKNPPPGYGYIDLDLNHGNVGWVMTRSLFEEIFNFSDKNNKSFYRDQISLDNIFNKISKSKKTCQISSILCENTSVTSILVGEESKNITEISKNTCVIIPHYNCNVWLWRTIFSIKNQNISPGSIIVIDDGSKEIPTEQVECFENVILLTTGGRYGPESITHNIIKQTKFDYYLIQDSDDFSCRERLYILIDNMLRYNADMVGSSAIQWLECGGQTISRIYKQDASSHLRNGGMHSLLYGTSIFSRQIFLDTGGFDANYQLSSDDEFVFRVAQIGTAINVRAPLYCRLLRENSLTAGRETGYTSKQRLDEREKLLSRTQSKTKISLEEKKLPPFIKFTQILGPIINLLEKSEL